jgi:hypothetical protein
VNVLRFPADFDPVRAAVRKLQQVKTSATLVDVVTHALYCGSMLLTNIDSSPKGTSAMLQLTFESIRIVSTGKTQAPQPTQPRDTPQKATGAQQPKPAPGPKKSALVAIGQWTGLLE